MSTRTATLVRITGRVQGVGFRAWTLEEAEALGLVGWVRNEPDGSVTVLMAGPKDAIEKMLQRLHAGPPGAKIAGVSTGNADAGDAGGEFRILH